MMQGGGVDPGWSHETDWSLAPRFKGPSRYTLIFKRRICNNCSNDSNNNNNVYYTCLYLHPVLMSFHQAVPSLSKGAPDRGGGTSRPSSWFCELAPLCSSHVRKSQTILFLPIGDCPCYKRYTVLKLNTDICVTLVSAQIWCKYISRTLVVVAKIESVLEILMLKCVWCKYPYSTVVVVG